MPTYLLDCACGEKLRVDSSLAGGQAVCDACGEATDIPSLRHLRMLPQVDEPPEKAATAEAPADGTNFLRNLGAILVLFSIAAIGVLLIFRFRAITGFTAEDAIYLGQRRIESLNMVQTWQMWGEIEEMGIGSRDEMGLPALEARRLRVMYVLMAVAGLIGVGGVVLFLRGGKPAETSDKKPPS